MPFTSLGLAEPLVKEVADMGYREPTPIQKAAIPEVLAGRDVIGCAQTGTGKTAAFILPTLQRISDKPGIKALVVTPTRELADQIHELALTCGKATGHRTVTLYGGVSYGPQEEKLRAGVDLVVATPGRLLDMIGRGAVRLSGLEVLILDEADRMLDMGFWPDVKRIIDFLPHQRQTLLFSATISPKILEFIGATLNKPVSIEIGRPATPVKLVDQAIYPVNAMQKTDLLLELLKGSDMQRVLIFVQTKRMVDRLFNILKRAGLPAAPIHSDLSQSQRQRTLSDFKTGQYRFLLATDIVARGIDIESVSHVINFDLPANPEDYVHRIGRTARAGEGGSAISFLDAAEIANLREIEALIGRLLPCKDLPGFNYRERFIPSVKKKVSRPTKRLVFNGGARRATQRRRRR